MVRAPQALDGARCLRRVAHHASPVEPWANDVGLALGHALRVGEPARGERLGPRMHVALGREDLALPPPGVVGIIGVVHAHSQLERPVATETFTELRQPAQRHPGLDHPAVRRHPDGQSTLSGQRTVGPADHGVLAAASEEPQMLGRDPQLHTVALPLARELGLEDGLVVAHLSGHIQCVVVPEETHARAVVRVISDVFVIRRHRVIDSHRRLGRPLIELAVQDNGTGALPHHPGGWPPRRGRVLLPPPVVAPMVEHVEAARPGAHLHPHRLVLEHGGVRGGGHDAKGHHDRGRPTAVHRAAWAWHVGPDACVGIGSIHSLHASRCAPKRLA